MKEIWKDIKDFEGRYQISNLGRVKSLTRTITEKNTGKTYVLYGKILKERHMSNGYIQACLCKNSKYTYKYVHRLVAQAFISNPNNLKQVNHIDCIKTNNSVKNLEWCSHLFNSKHAAQNGLFKRGENHHQTTLTDNQVKKIKTLLKKGLTQVEIASMFKVSKNVINTINVQKTWKHIK